MEVTYKLAESNEEIKSWVESHGGKPAIMDDPEVVNDVRGLRIDWPGEKDEALLSTGRDETRDISWEEFFGIMDRHELGFMYSENTSDVNPTWTYKFVNKTAVVE
jgi:hypothetical protein